MRFTISQPVAYRLRGLALVTPHWTVVAVGLVGFIWGLVSLFVFTRFQSFLYAEGPKES